MKHFSHQREKGQIIIVAPILILLILGAVLLTINVSMMVKEKIRIQVAADGAARSGAYVQAEGLVMIATMNDGIIAADAQIATGVGQVASIWPWEVIAGIKNIKEGRDTANSLRDAQSGIMDMVPVLIETTVFMEARASGYLGTAVPGLSTLSLDLKNNSFMNPVPTFWPFIPIRVRANSRVNEKVVVLLRKSAGSAIYGNSLLKGKNGGDLTYPSLYANSAGKPYYYLSHNAADDTLTSGFYRETVVSMIVPYPQWEAKLTKVR
jgi:hypothetical protein